MRDVAIRAAYAWSAEDTAKFSEAILEIAGSWRYHYAACCIWAEICRIDQTGQLSEALVSLGLKPRYEFRTVDPRTGEEPDDPESLPGARAATWAGQFITAAAQEDGEALTRLFMAAMSAARERMEGRPGDDSANGPIFLLRKAAHILREHGRCGATDCICTLQGATA